MAEPDYRAMLMAMMEAYENWKDRDGYGESATFHLPDEVEEWWENDPTLNRERAEEQRLSRIRSAEWELKNARAVAKAAEEEAQAWRDVRDDPREFISVNVVGAESNASAAAARVAFFEAELKALAETPSAQPGPQAADPERVVADLDASIPHPAPQ
jgi:hypothetical protein